MSDGPTYDLLLRFDLGEVDSALVVEDQTGDRPPVSSALPTPAPPFLLRIDSDPASPANLAVEVLPGQEELAFDPVRTTGARVLTVDAFIDDAQLQTLDNTHYILKVTNTSTYYVVEDLRLTVTLDPSQLSELLGSAAPTVPSGAPYIEIVPSFQHIRCLDPGEVRDIPFMAITRGVVPANYIVRVCAQYRVLYWDGREVKLSTSLCLPVEQPFSSGCGQTEKLPPPGVPNNQPSTGSNDMSNVSQFPVQSTPPVKPQLQPIECECALPGGGVILISYRLVWGQPNSSKCTPCYGRDPVTGGVDTHFETEDDANIELKVDNKSDFKLRHFYVRGVRLKYAEGDHSGGYADTDTLKNGNLVFEVAPREAYFGDLSAGQSAVRYLSIRSRGTESGCYWLAFCVDYDVEAQTVAVELGLAVKPD